MLRRFVVLRGWPLSMPRMPCQPQKLAAMATYGTSSTVSQQEKRATIFSLEKERGHVLAQSEEGDPWVTHDITEFGLSQNTLNRLSKAGIETLFPVQATTYEKAMQRQDIVVRAKTGSGKTLGFAVPIIENLSASPSKKSPRAIVLAPTRELAKQVESEFARIAGSLRTLSIYGGTSYEPQERALKQGIDVVVGTPGRVLDHLKKGHLKLDQIQHAVLDEADDMLQMGFREEVEKIYSYLPQPVNLSGRSDRVSTATSESRVHHMLWSATLPPWIKKLAKTFLHKPEVIDLVGSSSPSIPSTVKHGAVLVDDSARQKVLGSILDEYAENGRVLVFTETKAEAATLVRTPTKGKIIIASLTGDLSQQVRERTLQGFKMGKINVICATDVAARGLDIPSVDAVIHYRLPSQIDSFVHRTGRTGRAGNNGVNVALFSDSERNSILSLSQQLGFGWQFVSPDSVEGLRPGADSGREARIEKKISSLEKVVSKSLGRTDINAETQLVKDASNRLIEAAGGNPERALEAIVSSQMQDVAGKGSDVSLLTGQVGHCTLIYQPRLDNASTSSIHPEVSPRKTKRVIGDILAELGSSKHAISESKMAYYSGKESRGSNSTLLPEATPGVVFDLPSAVAPSVIECSQGTVRRVKELPESVARSLTRPTRKDLYASSSQPDFMKRHSSPKRFRSEPDFKRRHSSPKRFEPDFTRRHSSPRRFESERSKGRSYSRNWN